MPAEVPPETETDLLMGTEANNSEQSAIGQSGDTSEYSLVVAVGASAGGLESLERLFGQMPAQSALVFLVVQHLSPKHKSLMHELLSRRTSVQVVVAEDGMVLKPDTIFLMPPRTSMTVDGLKLVLSEQIMDELNLPIDRIFASVAQQAGPRAVAIVLSGTGSDGSRGVQNVKDAGGLVISESELTAKFTGMPDSATATGTVDYSVAPEEMPDLLLSHEQDVLMGADRQLGDVRNDVAGVVALLKDAYGIDFHHYKPGTVGRRIERRVELSNEDSLASYTDVLRQNSDELDTLYHDLLIGVTRFFRDEVCFERLEMEALPRLIRRLKPGEPFRAWVAACATGEEVYTLAMLLDEQRKLLSRHIDIKIFATDLHRGSLTIASRGVYSRERLAGVSEERLARYFERDGDDYRVIERLRECVVFAPHNILKDAPFTNLSLITCRNLLIYFEPVAQRKVLTLFHFALNTQGVMMLGPSETLGDLADEFSAIDESSRIYQKIRQARLPINLNVELPTLTSGGSQLSRRANVGAMRERIDPALLSTYDNLLSKFMPTSVLINEASEIVDSYGGATRFLHRRSGRPSDELTQALDSPMLTHLVASIRRVLTDFAPLTLKQFVLKDISGAELEYDLTIESVTRGARQGCYLLLSFKTEPEAGEHQAAEALVPAQRTDIKPTMVTLRGGELTKGDYAAIERDLRATRESLQASVEQVETSNEELQATNEELVASNEELQSSNEELNSVNEELHTVNTEYQSKIRELHELNEDMNHLLASTDIGTVFLDRELNIRRFTPGIDKAYKLTASDVGRSIEDFSHRLDMPDMNERFRDVLLSGHTFEREVRDSREHALLLRILPYQISGQMSGIVLTLTDISLLDDARTALADSEDTLKHRLAELQGMYQSAPAGLCFIDTKYRYVRANERMADIDGLNVKDYPGNYVWDVVPEDISVRVKEIIKSTFDTGKPVLNLKIRSVTRVHPDEARDYIANYYPVRDDTDNLIGCSVVIMQMPTASDLSS